MLQRNAEAVAKSKGDEYEMGGRSDPVYNLDEPKEAAIVNWRIDCFTKAGMSALDATALAVRRDVDRVYVERLLADGATSAQARDIAL